MTNDENLKQMTLEQRAVFLSKQRFFGCGVKFIVAWLKEEATNESTSRYIQRNHR